MRNGSFIFVEQLEHIREYLVNNVTWPSSETGFAGYVLRGDESLSRIILDNGNSLTNVDQGPVLSSLGYSFACHGIESKIAQDRWSNGFEMLIARDPFPIDRQSFFFRPTDLVGIALGAAATNTDPAELSRILKDGQSRVNRDDYWSLALSCFAMSKLGIDWSESTPNFQSMTLAELSLLYWLEEVSSPSGFSDMQIAAIELRLLELAGTRQIEFENVAKAAVILDSLSRVVRKYIKSAHDEHLHRSRDLKEAIRLVTEICMRFPFCARQLKNRPRNRAPLTLKDEYDVQYLLFALLCLHFDDVRPEEWTPSYAGNASRVDFLLKDQQLVIEAKMTRKGLDQKTVANQLIIDAKRYRTHPDCKHLLCFVYDPSNMITNPAALEKDVAEDGVDLSVSVIVAPR